MITEVSPAPKIYMFYALFQTVGVRICLMNLDSSADQRSPENVRIRGFTTLIACLELIACRQIGPFIGSAIIADSHGNNNSVFYLLLPMMIIGYALLWMVDPDKAKIDNAKCE